MLKNVIPQFYKDKHGQSLRAVAEAFSLPECAIVGFNSLKTELWEGHPAYPETSGKPLYRARGRHQNLAFGERGKLRAKKYDFPALSGHESIIAGVTKSAG